MWAGHLSPCVGGRRTSIHGLSQDCLFLNVFRPAWANATSKLPVMLFFHGGAFIEGDSKGPFGMCTYQRSR